MSLWTLALAEMEKKLLDDETATLSRKDCFTLLHQVTKLTRPSPLDDLDHCELELDMIEQNMGSGFATQLKRCFDAADAVHEHRLGIVFPEFGAAAFAHKTKGQQ
jgi:hypothetical protein